MGRSFFIVAGVMVIAFFAAWIVDPGQSANDSMPESVPDLSEGEKQALAGALDVPGASKIEGLGRYRIPITTSSSEAQKWFDQGLALTYGFNHEAAERSYLRAIESDPECAMCWWGASLVLGPHVNAPMDPSNNDKALMRVQKAQAFAAAATNLERDLINALSARYSSDSARERVDLDKAYAEQMALVLSNHGDSLDAATLYAEALMDLQPWNFYDREGEPLGRTEEFVSVLESVIEREPEHPGALHLYIHAVEASNAPERGVAAADRLRTLAPGSGHLVHMPAHIYTRVGRYNDAVIANQNAIIADDIYLANCRPAPGIYPLGYVPHNHHYLWWAASMQGAADTALAAARETASRANIPELIQMPGMIFLQDFMVTPLKAMVQFARWEEIEDLEPPPEEQPYPLAIWHFAQGMSAARQGRPEDAVSHHRALAAEAAEERWETAMIGPQHPLSGTLRVAERLLAGEIASARNDFSSAISAMKEAVEEEDSHAYYEPPVWHHPTRHSLGTIQIRAEDFKAAEESFRQDLRRNPENGWALFGLAKALRMQEKNQEASDVELRFARSWQHAQVGLTAPRL